MKIIEFGIKKYIKLLNYVIEDVIYDKFIRQPDHDLLPPPLGQCIMNASEDLDEVI